MYLIIVEALSGWIASLIMKTGHINFSLHSWMLTYTK